VKETKEHEQQNSRIVSRTLEKRCQFCCFVIGLAGLTAEQLAGCIEVIENRIE
jgi:hypothetical protein